VTTVPLALVSGLALRALLQEQLVQTEQSTLNLTRALATAVDNELRLTVSALQSLALADATVGAGEDGLAKARDLAVRALASRPEWRAVILLKPSGEVLFNTGYPIGAPLPPASDPSSLSEIVASRAPVVGSLARGPLGNMGIAVRVPVMRGDELCCVLTAILRPEAVLTVISRQRAPDDWIVSVFDANQLRVARSRDHQRFLGTPPTDSLKTMLSSLGARNQAYGMTETIEGEQVHTAVTRIGSTRWTVALGVPTSVSAAVLRSTALAYGGGIVLSVLLGGLAAWLVSRSIEKPIGRLKLAAESLGRGEPIHGAGSDVIEIEAMSEALVSAAAQRTRNAVEREQLLAAERHARSAAERAQERLQLLASAGTALSTMLDEATTLEAIASIIVPGVADVCRIDLLDKEGVLRRKLTYHTDPERAKEIAAFVSQHAASADTPGSFPWSIATGRPFLANFGPQETIGGGDPTFQAFARTVGMQAVCVMPLIARGRTIGAMAAIQAESGRRFEPEDQAMISELAKRAALALDNVHLFEDSQAALRQASVANRAKDEFLAMLGHELRNPLAPIVTSLELMKRKSGSENPRERQIIERQVRHLQRLVDDLLDVSRIASGKVELDRQPVDLSDIVSRALELTQPLLQARLHAPRVVAADRPVRVHGDPTRLTQVLCNLLTNAAKYSAPDADIDIEIRRANGLAELIVADKGVGIDADLLPRVFDQFVQGDQALNRASGGLGLGLAIAKNLVELHGGTISASSAGPGQGSTFIVRLPETPWSDVTTTAPAPLAQVDRQLRVLIVDDNLDAAQSLAVLLQMEGHDVRTAADGHEAIETLETFAATVAVLDIGLPGMDGYELARRIRSNPRASRVRLVALTGYGRDTDQSRAREAGFDMHLVKPVDLDAVLQTLALFA